MTVVEGKKSAGAVEGEGDSNPRLEVARSGDLLGREYTEEDRDHLVGRVVVAGLEVVLVLLFEGLSIIIERKVSDEVGGGGKRAETHSSRLRSNSMISSLTNCMTR